MKFLALGLLMFLQAGSLRPSWTGTAVQEPQQDVQNTKNLFIGSDGRCYRVNRSFDMAAQVADSACQEQFKNTGIMNAIPKTWITMGNGEPLNSQQQYPGFTSSKAPVIQKSTEIHDDTVSTWQSIYWDGKEAVKDVVTISSKPVGTQSLTVPSDWKCTPFTDGKTEPDLIGMVCTKPKRK